MKNLFIKYISLSLVFIIIISALLSGCQEKKPDEVEVLNTGDMNPEEIGRLFIGNLFDEEYKYTAEAFPSTEDMKTYMKKAFLKQLKDQLTEIHGNFSGIETVYDLDSDEYIIKSFLCKGKDTRYCINIVFNDKNEIAGINYTEYDPIDIISDKQGEKIELISGESGEIKLPGILQYDEETSPETLILIMPGSGPNDIDGSVGVIKPYEDLAAGMVYYGYAVYRYEKRTYRYKQELTSSLTPYEEEIEDMISAIRYFKDSPKYNFKKIYIIGHSLGGYLIPDLYKYLSEDDKKIIGGFIFMAPSASKIEDLFVRQAEAFAAADNEDQEEKEKQINEYKAIRDEIKKITAETPDNGNFYFGAGVDYYKYLLDYNPIESAKNIKDIKMAFIFGENDKNVDINEYNLWYAGMKNLAEVKLFQGLNHYFMKGSGLPSDISKPSNIDGAVIEYIAEFIK